MRAAILLCLSAAASLATASAALQWSSHSTAFASTPTPLLSRKQATSSAQPRPHILTSNSFLSGEVLNHNECAVGRGRASTTAVFPVMMGRAAAKRAVKKGKTDGAKAKLYSRYGKMVTMLVKAGGPDPVANVQLGKMLERAKQAGVPKTNMDNCIKRATSKEQADFKESTYEIYANGGIGFVCDILTDNSNRAAGDIRTVINRKGLKTAEPGSVSFNFDRVGCVTIETDKDEDTVTEAALEAGAQDLEAIDTSDGETKPGFNIYTETTDLMAVADSIKEQGYSVTDARFIWKPKAGIEVSEADAELNFDAIDMLEELDDVDAVFHNMA